MGVRFPWGAALTAVLVLEGAALPTRAVPPRDTRPPVCVQERGPFVAAPLLLEYYRDLPEPGEGDDAGPARLEKALAAFHRMVAARYTEATLQRLLLCPDDTVRRAAVLALSRLGTLKSNPALAARLHDGDPVVWQTASAALWQVWLRGDTEANCRELQRLMGLRDGAKVLDGLNALILNAPQFAEAYNQRAILHFQIGDFRKAVSDCEKVLQLNPYHFGAQSGMAEAYLRLRQPRKALQAYRAACKINPNINGIQDTIRDLEQALGEDGKK
jgi:tetratricopeptide (TPR) repeat protein